MKELYRTLAYFKHILPIPALKNHNDKSIGEYTKDDFEEAIELIKEGLHEVVTTFMKYLQISAQTYHTGKQLVWQNTHLTMRLLIQRMR